MFCLSRNNSAVAGVRHTPPQAAAAQQPPPQAAQQPPPQAAQQPPPQAAAAQQPGSSWNQWVFIIYQYSEMSIGTHKLRPIESHHSYSICVLSASEDYQDCINHVLQGAQLYRSRIPLKITYFCLQAIKDNLKAMTASIMVSTCSSSLCSDTLFTLWFSVAWHQRSIRNIWTIMWKLFVRHMYSSLKSRVYIWLLANIIVLTFVRVQPSKWA